MSKGAKKVLGVVVAVAVPFVAPAIASSIGLSATIGSVAGSAVVGAGMNAIGAKLTGQHVGRAALMGGVMGGIGGYMSGANAAAGGGGAQVGLNTTAGGGAYGIAPTPAASSLGIAAGNAPAMTGGITNGVANAAAGGGGNFLSALRSVPAAIAQQFTNPNVLANLTLRAAGMLAGSAIAGDGLTPEEQRLLEAQAADLEWLRQANRQAFEVKLHEAMNLIGEARYFDPEYFGLQAARRQQLAGAEQERTGLRGLSGDRRQAEQRRIRLGTARNAGTAFDIGYGQGVTARTQTRTAGINAIPMPNQYSGLANYPAIGNMYDAAEQRRIREAERIGNFFGEFTGPGLATYDGETDEERARREGRPPVIGGRP